MWYPALSLSRLTQQDPQHPECHCAGLLPEDTTAGVRRHYCLYSTQLVHEEFSHTFCFHLTKREHLGATVQAKKVGKGDFRLFVICTHPNHLFFPSWALSKVLKKVFIPTSKNELILFHPPDPIAFPLNAPLPNSKDEGEMNSTVCS